MTGRPDCFGVVDQTPKIRHVAQKSGCFCIRHKFIKRLTPDIIRERDALLCVRNQLRGDLPSGFFL
jgi:hypothetical protein